jgi:5-methylcytosine-specific restriction endonuclease McrA
MIIKHADIPEATRRAVLRRADGHCEGCGEPRPLELHHLHYDSIGREGPEDLAALCRDCHRGRHIDLNGDFWEDPRDKEDHWSGYFREMEKD